AQQDQPVSIFGASDGVATVTAYGGNVDYTYLWDNGESTATAIALNSGSHSVIVTDSKGCETTCNVIITEPGALYCNTELIYNAICYGEFNGIARVVPTGGVEPFTYLWDNNETSQTASALNAGSHSVIVKDANGAISTCYVSISEPHELIALAVQDNPVVCYGGANGAATLTVSGGNVPYSYAWDKSASASASAADLAAGLHTITITDAKGCVTTATVTITEPNILTATDVQTACDSYTWIDGNTYSASNNSAIYTMVNSNGCDSIVTLNLTVLKSSSETIEATNCGVVAVNGVEYTVSGTYIQNLTNAAGCDSTLTIIATVLNSTEGTIEVSGCGAVTVNGTEYTVSGTYTQELQNIAGCDSTLTIIATVLNSTEETIEVSGCGSVTVNETEYTVSGTYIQNLINAAGCDSTLTIVATVTVCITKPEMELADDDSSTLMNTPVTVSVQNNDSNIPEGSVISTPATTTIGGTIKVNTDGSVTYNPPKDFVGEDKFEYTISTPDGHKDSASVVITVTAPAELVIQAVDDEFEIYNDKIAEGSIISNDISPIGKIVINITPVSAPTNGTVVINTNGTIVYIPNPDFSGVDSFSYQICNSIVTTLCDIAEVKIIVMDTDTVPENPFTAQEIFIPNGYSPNDDGINDYFTITLYGKDSNGVYREQSFDSKFPDAKVEIFNRWGNLVFEKEGFGNTGRWGSTEAWWDGRSNKGLTIGKDKLPPGTYFYILYFNDGNREPAAGSVFLNR
ncbi:MAG: conserved repeat domain-containing, partial [Prolixibacteraceae bacterium]